jgi:hypothetical protein
MTVMGDTLLPKSTRNHTGNTFNSQRAGNLQMNADIEWISHLTYRPLLPLPYLKSSAAKSPSAQWSARKCILEKSRRPRFWRAVLDGQ